MFTLVFLTLARPRALPDPWHLGTMQVWGALHGMVSLAQLADEDCTITNAPVSVTDSPRFGFRGLMIDSSRHFLPVPFIMHILDAMQANKLNVLHWHIVDSNSFPCVHLYSRCTSLHRTLRALCAA